MIAFWIPCSFHDNGFQEFLIKKFKLNVLRELRKANVINKDTIYMLMGYISTLRCFYTRGGYLLRMTNKNLVNGLKLTRNDISMLRLHGACANGCYRVLWNALEFTKSNLGEYIFQYKSERV